MKRFLGMIQTDHDFFKALFTYEEEGEYYLVSDTGHFQDSWAGTLCAEPLMTGEVQLGSSVFAFDDSGAPYPNPGYRPDSSPIWTSWEETMISPIE